MLKIDFTFVKIGNELTGFRLEVFTPIKSFHIQLCFGIRRLEELPSGCYGSYTQLANPEDIEFFGEFRKFLE